MALELPSDFSDFLSLLNAHRVEYLLVGGYAVTIHGYVRATGDMDIFIAATPDNASRVADAIREFGFDVPSLTAAEILAPAWLASLREQLVHRDLSVHQLLGMDVRLHAVRRDEDTMQRLSSASALAEDRQLAAELVGVLLLDDERAVRKFDFAQGDHAVGPIDEEIDLRIAVQPGRCLRAHARDTECALDRRYMFEAQALERQTGPRMPARRTDHVLPAVRAPAS